MGYMTATRSAATAPLLPGADSYAFLDVDSTINRMYGCAKQGADYGYTRVRGFTSAAGDCVDPDRRAGYSRCGYS